MFFLENFLSSSIVAVKLYPDMLFCAKTSRVQTQRLLLEMILR